MYRSGIVPVSSVAKCALVAGHFISTKPQLPTRPSGLAWGAGNVRVPDEAHQLHVDVALERIGGTHIGLQGRAAPHGLGDIDLDRRAGEAFANDVAEHARA